MGRNRQCAEIYNFHLKFHNGRKKKIRYLCRGFKKITIMKQIIPVKGMGCAKCKARVENALNAIAGVNEARVSLENAQAIVDYDPAETSLEKMREEVEKAGYQLMVEEAK